MIPDLRYRQRSSGAQFLQQSRWSESIDITVPDLVSIPKSAIAESLNFLAICSSETLHPGGQQLIAFRMWMNGPIPCIVHVYLSQR